MCILESSVQLSLPESLCFGSNDGCSVPVASCGVSCEVNAANGGLEFTVSCLHASMIGTVALLSKNQA